MGLIRKTMSVSTLGAVDWRSDKERTAAYARGTRKHARRAAQASQQQVRIMQQQMRTDAAQSAGLVWNGMHGRWEQPVPAQQSIPTPAGWYPHPDGSGRQLWWDGYQWVMPTPPPGQ